MAQVFFGPRVKNHYNFPMSMKIVIVDDAPFIREVVSQMLAAGGFEVVGEASNGIEAVEKVLQLKPDVVLMDIVMPQMSGIEATKKILESWPQARIIACSTVDNETVVLGAIEAGCQDYVLKPFERESLIEVLKGKKKFKKGKR